MDRPLARVLIWLRGEAGEQAAAPVPRMRVAVNASEVCDLVTAGGFAEYRLSYSLLGIAEAARMGTDDAADPQDLSEGVPGTAQELGRALGQLRQRAKRSVGGKLTFRDLARQTNYSHGAINNWFRGLSLPSADCLGDLLLVLCATPAEQRMLATARDAIEETRHQRSDSRPAPPVRGRRVEAGPLPVLPLEVRCSLPPGTAAFTGRDREMESVMGAVTGAARSGAVVPTCAFHGMPGVGKTALAVHAARKLRGEFPARQLFIDLHAHTPGREPVRPEDALAALLAAAGADPRCVPGDLEGRAGMWRDKTAGQRALLVLDNAASSAQVAPLLPGEGCLVLVTSRRHLGDLPGAVVQVPLEVLPPQQAARMFTRLAPRAAPHPDEVADVVKLAGLLPLAVSLLARVFARHPVWTLADLAAETHASLLTLTAERDSIAAAFGVSYRYLDPGRRRLFGLLGLHPGITIDAHAAGALAGVSPAEAAVLLDGLHGEGLVTETCHRRYSMHDLLRRYARDHAADPADGQAAEERLLDYYQHTAGRAEARLARQTRPGPAVQASPYASPALDDAAQALTWIRAERASLLGCLDHATRTGQDTRVIALTAALTMLLRRDGPWDDATTIHRTAVRAARRLGDRLGEANALTNLAGVRWLTDDYPGAAQDAANALGIYRDLGDRLGEANALTNLAGVRWLTDDYPGAAQDAANALGIYRDLGDRLGEANALTSLAGARRMTGDYPGAVRDFEHALGIYRDLGDRLGEAIVLNHLAVTWRMTGDHDDAAQAAERALRICGDLGDRAGEAFALNNLAVTRRMTGDYPGAVKAFEESLGICRYIGDRGGEAEILNEQGTLYRLNGAIPLARSCHQQALELARAIPSSWDEARALAGLGRCAVAAGHPAQAHVLLSKARETFQRIRAADHAHAVLSELDALTSRKLPGKPLRGPISSSFGIFVLPGSDGPQGLGG